MRVKALLVLVAGLVLAGGSVGLTHLYYRARAAAPADGAAAAALPMTDIVIARVEIPFGKQLTPDLLTVRPWPKEALPVGAFTTVEELIGGQGAQPRRAKRAFAVGEPIITSKVAGFGEKVSFADVIDPNHRAVAIRVNDVTGVAGFVTPGDRVDIVLTRRLDNQQLRADTILQNVTVRGVDQVADHERDKPSVVRTVTVEVDPDGAQKLTLAQQAGTLSLLLRNVGSDQLVQLSSLRTSDLAPDPEALERGEAVSETPVVQPQVQVVRGGERTATAVPR